MSRITKGMRKTQMALSSKTQAMAALFEFSLNVFTEFTEFGQDHWIHWIQWQKYFSLQQKGSNLPPSHLLCKGPGCYHSTSKTYVRDKIFKLNPIHASVIYQIPRIQWILFPFRENSIVLLPMETEYFKIRWVVAWYRFSRSYKHFFCQSENFLNDKYLHPS